jgi:hypothetical protein
VYSTGIDAFTVDWHGINGLFVPPKMAFLLFPGEKNYFSVGKSV